MELTQEQRQEYERRALEELERQNLTLEEIRQKTRDDFITFLRSLIELIKKNYDELKDTFEDLMEVLGPLFMP